MVNDANDNNHSTNPGAIIPSDIDTALAGDNTTLFQSVKIQQKFDAKTTPKIKIDPNYQQQHQHNNMRQLIKQHPRHCITHKENT